MQASIFIKYFFVPQDYTNYSRLTLKGSDTTHNLHNLASLPILCEVKSYPQVDFFKLIFEKIDLFFDNFF